MKRPRASSRCGKLFVPFFQGLRGIYDGGLDQAAHLHDHRLDRFKIAIEGGGDMLAIVHRCVIYPIRPVI